MPRQKEVGEGEGGEAENKKMAAGAIIQRLKEGVTARWRNS